MKGKKKEKKGKIGRARTGHLGQPEARPRPVNANAEIVAWHLGRSMTPIVPCCLANLPRQVWLATHGLRVYKRMPGAIQAILIWPLPVALFASLFAYFLPPNVNTWSSVRGNSSLPPRRYAARLDLMYHISPLARKRRRSLHQVICVAEYLGDAQLQHRRDHNRDLGIGKWTTISSTRFNLISTWRSANV
jgi:hypothetical protein